MPRQSVSVGRFLFGFVFDWSCCVLCVGGILIFLYNNDMKIFGLRFLVARKFKTETCLYQKIMLWSYLPFFSKLKLFFFMSIMYL